MRKLCAGDTIRDTYTEYKIIRDGDDFWYLLSPESLIMRFKVKSTSRYLTKEDLAVLYGKSKAAEVSHIKFADTGELVFPGVTYSIGDRFTYTGVATYILASIGPNEVALINLNNGQRFTDGVTVNFTDRITVNNVFNITEDEFRIIACKDEKNFVKL